MTPKIVKTFEYGVILNGSKTGAALTQDLMLFEYGVILNGSKTWLFYFA